MSDVPPPPGGYTPPGSGQPSYPPPGGSPGYGAPQPAYGQPAYGAPQPGYGAAGPKTNVMAIVSLCLGLAGIVTCGVTCLAGLPLGIVALSQIKKSEGRETGRGLALGGIISSALVLVLGIGAWVGLVLLADNAENIVDEICDDIDTNGDGVADGDDCDELEFDTTTIP
jgi:hypothetical protein